MAKNGTLISTTKVSKLKDNLGVSLEKLQSAIAKRLMYVGEDSVRVARELTSEEGSFRDVTGNLRSSIGYVVTIDGKGVSSYKLEAIKGSQGSGSQGSSEGNKLLQKLSGKVQKGIALHVCAGMNYAAEVENIRHKDVLTSAELNAEKGVKERLGKLLK